MIADQFINVIECVKSYLIAFFDYNWDYIDSRKILYIDFPAIYVYK